MDGKVIKLAYAAALIPEDDKSRVVLLLTDTAVPGDVLSGKSSTMMSQMTSKAPFTGLELTFDAKRQIVSAYVYEKDSRTATSGLFATKFDGPSGKALIGSVASTDAAAKLKNPMKLDVKFSAMLK